MSDPQPKHDTPTPSRDAADAFSREAAGTQPGLVAEFVDFLRHNKKWWLTPIIIVLLLVAGLVVGGSFAPFIYTLF